MRGRGEDGLWGQSSPGSRHGEERQSQSQHGVWLKQWGGLRGSWTWARKGWTERLDRRETEAGQMHVGIPRGLS